VAEQRAQRRLAAILAADIVGYSRLMGKDEAGTLAQLKTLRKEIFDPRVAEHNGRIVKSTGDGVLVEFASAVDATECAIAVQRALERRNEDVPEDHRIQLRIGINLGDIIADDGDIYGDGVNVAARVEGLCAPGEVYVAGTVRDHVAGKLAASFDDLGDHTVKNIAMPVRVWRVKAETQRAPDDAERASIAVLPFANMSRDPDQEYFSDGITEDIITALSHIRQFFVIARNTTFTYKGQAVDVSAVAKDLGVRYVIEGSVRKAGNRVRITVQLIDGASGNHLWAERYDRELEDVFAVQDEITQAVVGAIQPEVAVAELERAKAKPPERMDAWDFYLRGKARYHLYSRDGVAEAVSLLERAIELDPNFAVAHAALAQACQHQLAFDFVADREATRFHARQATDSAVALARDDAETQVALGWTLWSEGETEEAVSVFQNALKQNPSHANAHSLLGLCLGSSSNTEEGIAHHETVLRLSPRDPGLASFLARYAFNCICARRHEQALDLAKNAVRLSGGRNWMLFCHTIVAAAYLERIDEAKAQVERMKSLHPEITIDSFRKGAQYIDPDHLEHYLDGLRKAGLPDG
jgi:adenylate cyclase